MARWVVAAAAAAALACGDGAIEEEAACLPENCLTLGATCGAIEDGCGGTLECGACAPGQTCGAASPNVCGVGPCEPTTCEAKGATCGVVADGCGGTLTCGTCPEGQTCGGGGTPGACGAPPGCQATTCAAAGASCGTIPDGCGGELACGECRDGEACGAAGEPNVCAPVPPTGDVGWSAVVSTPGPDLALGAGEDAAGNRYLLTFTQNEVGATHTLRLQRLDAAGKLAMTREWEAVGFRHWERPFRMSVTPAGSVYLAASAECVAEDVHCARAVDFGEGRATGSVLVKLGPDGRLAWQRELSGSRVASLATNDQGSVLVARHGLSHTASNRIEKYGHDGALLRSVEVFAQAVALDPSGNLIAADMGWVRKYAPDGALVWAKALPGAGHPLAAATTAKGTIVVLAQRTGDVEFGTSRVRSGALVLYVLEADARPRFARGLPWSGVPSLAVDPTGRAAVVGSGSCGEIVVEAFDLSNADLWRRFLPDGGRCWAGMAPGPASYGSDHRLLVTGSFAQTVEIGGRTWSPRGQDALCVLLDP